MGQSNDTSFREEGQKDKKRPLLVLLMLLVLITTSLVGFILGRSAGPAPLGQIIDTILLDPHDLAGAERQTASPAGCSIPMELLLRVECWSCTVTPSPL